MSTRTSAENLPTREASSRTGAQSAGAAPAGWGGGVTTDQGCPQAWAEQSSSPGAPKGHPLGLPQGRILLRGPGLE